MNSSYQAEIEKLSGEIISIEDEIKELEIGTCEGNNQSE
jgi:hypothetical protein